MLLNSISSKQVYYKENEFEGSKSEQMRYDIPGNDEKNKFSETRSKDY